MNRLVTTRSDIRIAMAKGAQHTEHINTALEIFQLATVFKV